MEDPYSFIFKRKDGWRVHVECSNFWHKHFWLDPKHSDPNSIRQEEVTIPIMTLKEASKKGWICNKRMTGWLCPKCVEEMKARCGERKEAEEKLKQEILEILKEHNHV